MSRRAIPATEPLLAMGFAAWSEPLHAYLSRHVIDRRVRDRIVREIVSENLDLLLAHRDQAWEVAQLKAAANRRIAEVMTGEELIRSRPNGLAWQALTHVTGERRR